MKYDKLKKGIVSLALTGAFLLGSGFVGSVFAMNSYDYGQYPRETETGIGVRETETTGIGVVSVKSCREFGDWIVNGN